MMNWFNPPSILSSFFLVAMIMPVNAENALFLSGVLTSEGVECPAMRADDGTLYTLLGDLQGLSVGQRVRVDADLVEMSKCMQGITIMIRRIEVDN